MRLEAQQKKRLRLAQVGAGARKLAEVAAKRNLSAPSTGNSGAEASGEKTSPSTAGSLLKDIKRQARQALEDIR